MRLWFETHSTSVDNERGVASGHLDVPLSDVGRSQAAELGSRYAERNLRLLYTSDLARALNTAEIAFGHSAVHRVSDRRLRECDYGTWTGCSVHQMHDHRARFVDEPFPDGESFRDVARRVKSFLDDATRERPVLIIGHRATWYAFEHLLHDRDLVNVVTSRWEWQRGWEYEL